jgi:hypothetical protein
MTMNKLNTSYLRFKSKDYNLNLHKSIQLCRELHLSLLGGCQVSDGLVTELAIWYDFVARTFQNKGQSYSLQYLKECRMLFLCFLSGNKYQQKGNLRVARHRDLLPKRLGSSLCNRVRKLDPDVLKHVLTALMITRNIALHGTPPDYSTITNGRVPELTVQLKKFVTREIRRKNWKVSLRPFFKFSVNIDGT